MVPGSTGPQGTIARSEGAATAAKVANTPTNIPTQGGGSNYGYPSDIIGQPPALRGGQTPQSRQVPVTDERGNIVGYRMLSSGPSAPSRGSASQPSSSQPSSSTWWPGMPQLSIPNGIGQGNDFQRERLKLAAQKDSELSTKLGEQSSLAEQQLEYSREARQALNGAETGPMSEWLTRNRAALIEAGVPEALIPGSGTVVPTLELNKALKNAALQGARQIYGPRMTQTEVKLQTDEMSPSSSMMRDAIASLQRQNDIRALYSKQMGTDYGRYIQQGGDPFRFESSYATRFPLTRFAQAANASLTDLQAEARRRGLPQQ
jgi:hypothetical protein